MDPVREHELLMTRRHFFGRCSAGIGVAALGSLLSPQAMAALTGPANSGLGQPHFAPKAKRIIYLFMSGGPSQIDLFDYKPQLQPVHGNELPDSVRMGQRLTGMTSGQSSFPMVSSMFKFDQHGQSGHWVSDRLPYIASVSDDLCYIKTVNTEAINHDPAITYIQTGSQQPGRPSVGAWLSYGLGSENHDLPSFIVMLSRTSMARPAQALFDRLWGAGFLPSEYQGVKFRSGGDPVLYLSNPPGVDATTRRRMLDGLANLNAMHFQEQLDPEVNTRIAQYEMAYRMQTSVPDLADTSDEPDHIFELYGEAARKPGTFASNCLLARRLAERGVRFIQLFHRDWDQHNNLPNDLTEQCRDVDQASAALVTDLKQRGMLEDTLIIWGGEFGRTVYCQGKLTADNYGRDHHGRCFTVWMAGGGVKPGFSFGKTDDFCYNIVENPVHIHDLNATVLHLMGIDHLRLTYPFQGRDFRLTDVHGNVVRDIIA
ncbi:MAG: DUF1501 domain-containing protein [Candidatus Hydrogenedentes bacterium]|nr:DUF1501 domain-containing protein [Candidatus Hydrogenedentota bacterium]